MWFKKNNKEQSVSFNNANQYRLRIQNLQDKLTSTLSIVNTEQYIFDGTLHSIVSKIINFVFAQGLMFDQDEQEQYYEDKLFIVIQNAIRMMFFYGSAYIVIRNSQPLSKPLSSSNREKFIFDAYSAQDLLPVSLDMDVDSDSYLQPTGYRLISKLVHNSRVIPFHYIKLPSVNSQQNRKQYISLPMLLAGTLYAKNEIIQALAQGVRNLSTLNIGLSDYYDAIRSGELDAVNTWIELFKQQRDNGTIILTDSERMKMEPIEQSINGIMDAYNIVLKQLGMDTGLGTLILTGEKIVGSGLNTSNNAEMSIFYNIIRSIQKLYILPSINLLFQSIGYSSISFKDPEPIMPDNKIDNLSKKIDIINKGEMTGAISSRFLFEELEIPFDDLEGEI